MYIDGESLSSFILRNTDAFQSGIGEQERLKMQEIIEGAISNGDIDFGYTSDRLESITAALGIERPLLARISDLPSWGLLLDSDERVQFCPSCVQGDLKVIRFPVWRLAWGYSHYTVCEIHSRPLQVLRGEYRCNNPLYRINSTARYMVDFECGKVEKGYSSELDLLLDMLVAEAKEIQGFLEMWRVNSDSDKLVLFFKLYSVFLRAYIKPAEPPPYCYQLAKSLRQENGAPVAPYGTPLEALLYGHQRSTSVTARIIALVVVAVILDVGASRYSWGRIVSLFAKIGVLVPNSPAWLFTSCTGSADQGVRDWVLDDRLAKLCLASIIEERSTPRVE